MDRTIGIDPAHRATVGGTQHRQAELHRPKLCHGRVQAVNPLPRERCEAGHVDDHVAATEDATTNVFAGMQLVADGRYQLAPPVEPKHRASVAGVDRSRPPQRTLVAGDQPGLGMCGQQRAIGGMQFGTGLDAIDGAFWLACTNPHPRHWHPHRDVLVQTLAQSHLFGIRHRQLGPHQQFAAWRGSQSVTSQRQRRSAAAQQVACRGVHRQVQLLWQGGKTHAIRRCRRGVDRQHAQQAIAGTQGHAQQGRQQDATPLFRCDPGLRQRRAGPQHQPQHQRFATQLGELDHRQLRGQQQGRREGEHCGHRADQRGQQTGLQQWPQNHGHRSPSQPARIQPTEQQPWRGMWREHREGQRALAPTFAILVDQRRREHVPQSRRHAGQSEQATEDGSQPRRKASLQQKPGCESDPGQQRPGTAPLQCGNECGDRQQQRDGDQQRFLPPGAARHRIGDRNCHEAPPSDSGR